MGTFLVFHGTADTVEIRCGEKIVDSLYFTGLKLIRVPEGCWAGSAFFNLQAGALVYSEDALLKLAPVTIDTGLLRHHPESNVSAMAQLLLDTGRDIHIHPDVVVPSPSSWAWYAAAAGLVSVFVTLMAFFLLFVKWLRLPRPLSGEGVSITFVSVFMRFYVSMFFPHHFLFISWVLDFFPRGRGVLLHFSAQSRPF